MTPTSDPSAPDLQGSVDAVVVLAPIVPEKAEAWRRLMQELAGARSHEHEASRRRLGIRAERAWISETRHWTIGLIVIEADGVRPVLATLATSRHAFDCWFREQVRALQGLDLAARSPAAAPELLFTWRDNRETEIRR